MLRRATATASTRNLLQQSGGLERATSASALSLLNSGGLTKLSTSQGSASTSSGDADDGDAQSRLFRRMLDTPPRRPPHQPAFATLKEVSSSSSRGSVLARISERISRATGRRSSRALGSASALARPTSLVLDSPRWRGTTATEADAAASSPTESPDVGSARRVSAQI